MRRANRKGLIYAGPPDFTGKPWEESRWLGYLIKERTIVMSKDKTWQEAHVRLRVAMRCVAGAVAARDAEKERRERPSPTRTARATASPPSPALRPALPRGHRPKTPIASLA